MSNKQGERRMRPEPFDPISSEQFIAMLIEAGAASRYGREE